VDVRLLILAILFALLAASSCTFSISSASSFGAGLSVLGSSVIVVSCGMSANVCSTFSRVIRTRRRLDRGLAGRCSRRSRHEVEPHQRLAPQYSFEKRQSPKAALALRTLSQAVARMLERSRGSGNHHSVGRCGIPLC
jgi:hypothetical protein